MGSKQHRRGVRVGVIVGVVAVVLVVVASAVAALTQVAVLTGVPDQITPAAAGTTLSWSRNGPSDGGPYNEYVRVGSGPITQVNGAGTQAYGGGISGTTLVYQRVYKGQSDIRFYDIAAHTYSSPPAGWNTSAWEWGPTVSGNLVLFGRQTGSGTTFTAKVYLGDRTTGALTLLSSRTGRYAIAESGQVNGNYAVWWQCQDYRVSCNVYRYDIAAKTTMLIPNTFPSGPDQYRPSVTTTGTVYFLHAGSACGSSVTLVRQPLGGSDTVLVTFNKGIDVSSTYVDNTTGTPTIYYSKFSCTNSGNHGDIYKVID
jgi:hypothetical protein